MEEARYNEMIALNKLKEKYHKSFRKSCCKGEKNRMEKMLLAAWRTFDSHPARSDYNRLDGITANDRLEFRALQELIKIYQVQADKITKAK
jgi:hypothetical protein